MFLINHFSVIFVLLIINTGKTGYSETKREIVYTRVGENATLSWRVPKSLSQYQGTISVKLTYWDGRQPEEVALSNNLGLILPNSSIKV